MIYLLQSLIGRKSHTDFIAGLIVLSKYYKKYNKIIYAAENTYNLFENNMCTFRNIEKNNAFNVLKHIYSDPSKYIYDIRQMFAAKITKSTNINDIYTNGMVPGIDNFIIDNTVEYYYNNHHSSNNNELHYINNDSKQINSVSFKINTKIDIDKSVLQKFTKNKYFISLPTWRLEGGIDIKILDIFIKYLINETDYKDIILISGSNYYKNYFYDRYGIITTHLYSNGFECTTSYRKQSLGFLNKEKGSLHSLLTDCIYVQDSPASYIDFTSTYIRFRDDLEKFGMKKFKNIYYDKYIKNSKRCAFDIICKELKFNKMFYY